MDNAATPSHRRHPVFTSHYKYIPLKLHSFQTIITTLPFPFVFLSASQIHNQISLFPFLAKKDEEIMLAIFKKEVVNPPMELHSPAAASLGSSKNPKLPQHIIQQFLSSHPPNAFQINFANAASLSYVPPQSPHSFSPRLFCGFDNMYCMFLGSLNNLCSLNRQYGLSKGSNEAMLVVEAYRTLRDRGPYPAHEVLRDLDGSFGFVIYDSKTRTVFAALGANEGVRLFWGIAADGSVVISDDLEVIKSGCAKSFAPFPAGCMFHSEQGLVSFEHPRSRMKAMPRVDSEGVMCGANFKVDVQSRMASVPRVGSEADWALSGSHA